MDTFTPRLLSNDVVPAAEAELEGVVLFGCRALEDRSGDVGGETSGVEAAAAAAEEEEEEKDREGAARP